MSAFLGKIHYWLYNKILLQEHLLEEILKLAESKGYKTAEIVNKSSELYGEPVRGALESHIDHGNIHGWLQERIHSVEGRLAFSVTELLKQDNSLLGDFAEIYRESGSAVMNSIGAAELSVQDMYTAIFDNMLEGMPCDRVNEIVVNDEGAISWRTTACLHSDFWDEAGGDIANFHILRDAWINGFSSAASVKVQYLKTDDGTNTIRRV